MRGADQIHPEQIRGHQGILGFNLPTSLYPFLLSHLASTFNLFPNANSPTRPPYTVVTGKKVSYQDDMRYGFGSVVVVNNTETSSPSHSSSPHMERGARGVVAVVVGRDCAVNGGLRVYIPSKCVVVVRRYAKPGPLSSDLIALMNKRAEECRQTDLTDRVVRIGGQYVLPQPLIEDTVPPNMTPNLPDHSRGGHMPASLPPRGAPRLASVQSPIIVDSTRMDPSQTLSLPVEREFPEDVNAPPLSPAPPEQGPPGQGDITELPLPPSPDRPPSSLESRLPSSPPTLPDPLPSSRGGDTPSLRYPQRDRSTTFGRKNGFVSFLTVRQANRQYPNMVNQAVRKELRQLCERGTFRPVHAAPKGEKVVHSSVMVTPSLMRRDNSLR
jgi:hypothetical protein